MILFVFLLLSNLHNSYGFERVVLKAFTQPSNTELKDLWDTYNEDFDVTINQYL